MEALTVGIYPVLRGWLTKSPPESKLHGKFFKAKWRRRFFVLYIMPQSAAPGPQGALVYFDSEQQKKRRGAIELSMCEEVQSSLHFMDYQFLFSVRTKQQGKDRTYFLAADTEHEMIRWVDGMCTVLGLKEDTENLIPANMTAVPMPSSMSASDFSMTNRKPAVQQPPSPIMPSIQAGTVGYHLLQQQLAAGFTGGGGVVTTATGLVIPESILPVPPEKLGADGKLRKLPLSAEMEQQVLETYNKPGMSYGAKAGNQRLNGKKDEVPPPLPQGRSERKPLVSSPLKEHADIGETYDSPPSAKISANNLDETYDTPPPAHVSRASSDETYDTPPQKVGKSKKAVKNKETDSLGASADETYDAPPKKDIRASSDETYDTPPKNSKNTVRASADETYDKPPKKKNGGAADMRSSEGDLTYDAPPKSKKDTVRASADETYDTPPKKDAVRGEMFPLKSVVESVRKSADETYDSPPKKHISNNDRSTANSCDETYDAPPKRGSADKAVKGPVTKPSQSVAQPQTVSTVRETRAGEGRETVAASTADTEYDTPRARLPDKKGKKKDDKPDKEAQSGDNKVVSEMKKDPVVAKTDTTAPNSTTPAVDSKANRSSVELPARGIFFTSKSHSFRKDVTKPPVLPKRFDVARKDAETDDSSDDSDTSKKSLENLEKVGKDDRVMEETKTGNVQLMPTLTEVEAGDTADSQSTAELKKKKKKKAK